MKTMQSLILENIEEAITDAGLEPIQTPEWANTGCVRAMSGLLPVVEIYYDFQTDYVRLRMKGPGIRALRLQDNPPLFRIMLGETAEFIGVRFEKPERLEFALATLRDALCAPVG